MRTAKFKEQVAEDIAIVRGLLPISYIVKESDKEGSVICMSQTGISDDEDWRKTFRFIKLHFGSRFQEVYHNVNYNHKNFIIYLKPND